MSVFRPKNINRRLVGTAATNTTVSGKGSPGNAGQIGPKKVPYIAGAEFIVGCRCEFGCCSGVFKTNESRCGRKECCQCALIDYKGFFICCGPSTNKWFVAPACTEVSRNWYSRADAVTLANSCMGSCGWFVPTTAQMVNPGYCCRAGWDSFCVARYWTNNDVSDHQGGMFNFVRGSVYHRGNPHFNQDTKHNGACVRAFRCTAT